MIINSSLNETIPIVGYLGNNLKNAYSGRYLDVYGGSSDNLANINLWAYHGGDSQQFKIGYTEFSTYVILSKVSNYEKAVVVHNKSVFFAIVEKI